jgi:hypothetical protein
LKSAGVSRFRFSKSCGKPIVSGGNAPEVLQSAEGILDASSFFVEALVEAEQLLSIAAVRNDRLGSVILQPEAQFVAVVCFVTDQPRGHLGLRMSRSAIGQSCASPPVRT